MRPKVSRTFFNIFTRETTRDDVTRTETTTRSGCTKLKSKTFFIVFYDFGFEILEILEINNISPFDCSQNLQDEWFLLLSTDLILSGIPTHLVFRLPSDHRDCLLNEPLRWWNRSVQYLLRCTDLAIKCLSGWRLLSAKYTCKIFQKYSKNIGN